MTEPSGYTALDLIGFTDKGEYDAATNYVRNDLVHVGNDVWKCLADDTLGVTPAEGAYWTIFIENDSAASNVNYTNTSSGLAATDVQNAIDELASEKADSATTLAGYGIADAYTSTQADNAISTAINALDVSDSAVAGSYVTAVSEADGSISVTREAADATPTASSTKMVTSGGVYTALANKADQTVIGSSYNASTNYVVGDRFTDNGVRYKVNVPCIGITPPNANYYEVLCVDEDTKELESDIDTLNSSLTVSSVSVTGGTLFRYGKVVVLRVSQWSDPSDITIPSGYLPTTTHAYVAEQKESTSSSTVSYARLSINSSGTISLTGSNTLFIGTFVWITS